MAIQSSDLKSSKGLFVTGTDTGVGKTLVACTVVRILREQKIDAVGFKPVATGVVGGRWEDADALFEANERCEPLDTVCPVRYDAPLAPTLAAQHAKRVADLEPARRMLAELKARHAAVIVEGVGGVLVPLDAKTLVVDFMKESGCPALIVCRAALGTINHTLLTIREIERAGIPIAGIVMNCSEPIEAATARETKVEIERISGRTICAALPFMEGTGGPELAADLLRLQFDVVKLLALGS